MGGWLAKFAHEISGTEEKIILMLGLDAAGKTTILNYFALGDVVTTTPTIGECYGYK